MLSRWRDDDGSTLLMYPFAVLIVLALGAIAVDGAVLFQAHRQTVDVASGLATDIAGIVDEAAFAEDGTVTIDRARASDVIRFANAVDLAGHPNQLRCSASVSGDPEVVEVVCTGRGQALLLPVAGIGGAMTLRGTATAAADERD